MHGSLLVLCWCQSSWGVCVCVSVCRFKFEIFALWRIVSLYVMEHPSPALLIQALRDVLSHVSNLFHMCVDKISFPKWHFEQKVLCLKCGSFIDLSSVWRCRSSVFGPFQLICIFPCGFHFCLHHVKDDDCMYRLWFCCFKPLSTWAISRKPDTLPPVKYTASVRFTLLAFLVYCNLTQGKFTCRVVGLVGERCVHSHTRLCYLTTIHWTLGDFFCHVVFLPQVAPPFSMAMSVLFPLPAQQVILLWSGVLSHLFVMSLHFYTMGAPGHAGNWNPGKLH